MCEDNRNDPSAAHHPGSTDRPRFRYIAVGRWAGMTEEQIEAEIRGASTDPADPRTRWTGPVSMVRDREPQVAIITARPAGAVSMDQ